MIVKQRLDEFDFSRDKMNSMQIPGLGQTTGGPRWGNAGTRGQVRWLIQAVHGDGIRQTDGEESESAARNYMVKSGTRIGGVWDVSVSRAFRGRYLHRPGKASASEGVCELQPIKTKLGGAGMKGTL